MIRIKIDIEKYKSLVERGINLNAYHNRAFLGVTALPLFTLYDCYTSLDKETRNNSLAKTWAKILVGTATGIAVRYGGFKFAKRFANAYVRGNPSGGIIVEESNRKWGSALFPKNRLGEYKMDKKDFNTWKSNFHKAFGTYVAIAAMAFTNFSVDMPLTMFLTDFFREKFFPKAPLDTQRLRQRLGGGL